MTLTENLTKTMQKMKEIIGQHLMSMHARKAKQRLRKLNPEIQKNNIIL